jgi:hypothetical protein
VRIHADRSAPQADPWLLILLAPIGAAALLAARFFPFSALPTMCTMKLMTGQPCLACGMTRSWIHLAHGHPLAAVAQNPLGAILFAVTAVSLLYLLLRRLGLPALRLDTSNAEAWLIRGLVIGGIVVNWLYVAVTRVA